MNEILGLLGTVCICVGFYLFAKNEKESKENAWDRVIDLRVEVQELEEENEKINRKFELRNRICNETLETNKKLVKQILDNEIEKKELHKTILFDNDILTQKTEMLEQANNRFAKERIEIADLTHDICVANTELGELEEKHKFAREIVMSRYDEIKYLRRELKRVRANRLKKVIKAEKFGGVR